MKVIEQKYDDFIEVKIEGEVDIYNTNQLKEKLYSVVENNKLNLKLDCSKLDYIDSMGLGILVGALKRVNEYDKKIYIYNLKGSIKKLFLITGLDKLFVIK